MFDKYIGGEDIILIKTEFSISRGVGQSLLFEVTNLEFNFPHYIKSLSRDILHT